MLSRSSRLRGQAYLRFNNRTVNTLMLQDGDRNGAPLVIEAAICPYRPGEPVFDVTGMIAEAKACLAAGAAIVHHHHDMRMDETGSTAEMVSLGRAVTASFPDALLYPDFLTGSTVEDYIAHIEPLARIGAIDFVPVDPGAGYSGQLDPDGIPIGLNKTRFTFNDANVALQAATRLGLPVTIGVFEPFHLRWALAHAARGGLPAGSMAKLYFGGNFSLINIGRRALNFGLPPVKASLDAYLEMIGDSGLSWSVGLIGDSLLDSPLARYAIERGGHLRVGTEDVAGQTDATNAETVATAAALARDVGRPVVQGAAARAALGRRQLDTVG